MLMPDHNKLIDLLNKNNKLMKNFSHVYPPGKNPFPKKISSNKPPLNSSTNNSFGKNSSMRTFNHFNPIKSTNHIKAERFSSKSIE